MAVYTTLMRPQIEEFLAHYDVGNVQEAQGILAGVENTNYYVRTSRDQFILTLVESRTDARDLPFILGFQDHLSTRGIVCPRAVPDRGGKVLHTLSGKPAVLITFLKGQGCTPDDVTPEICAQVGDLLARMHLAGADYSATRANSVDMSVWEKLAARIGTRADDVQPGLYQTILDELAFLRRHWVGQRAHLPRGAVHADVFTDNVFRDGGKITGVIDFYFSCTESFVYDLMVTIGAWCFDTHGQEHATRTNAFLEAYQVRRPLSADEKAMLAVAGRAQALRFLLTRLHDFVFHDSAHLVQPKNPLPYLRILERYRHD